MKALRLLQAEVKKNGVASAAIKLGLRDTQRLKNWIYRKSVPEIMKPVVIKALTNEDTKH